MMQALQEVGFNGVVIPDHIPQMGGDPRRGTGLHPGLHARARPARRAGGRRTVGAPQEAQAAAGRPGGELQYAAAFPPRGAHPCAMKTRPGSPAGPPLTMADVARATGRSLNTVSRALNGEPDVSAETRGGCSRPWSAWATSPTPTPAPSPPGARARGAVIADAVVPVYATIIGAVQEACDRRELHPPAGEHPGGRRPARSGPCGCCASTWWRAWSWPRCRPATRTSSPQGPRSARGAGDSGRRGARARLRRDRQPGGAGR